MKWQTVVWIYTALLIVGGVIGFVKAGSKISLIASVLFAVPLVLTLTMRWPAKVAVITLAVHFLYFASSYARKKKFMPGGLLALASLAAGIFVFLQTR